MVDTTSIGLLTVQEIVEHLMTRCASVAIAYRFEGESFAHYEWMDCRPGAGFESMAHANMLYEAIKDACMYPDDDDDAEEDEWCSPV